MSTEKYKKNLLKIILKHLPDAKIIVYGSRARGDFKEGSDIDIALDNKKKIDRQIIFDIKEEFEESTIPIGVDLVDINSISESLKKEIIRDGVIWKN